MNVSPIQGDFSYGEISPRLHSRVSSPLYQSGLAECTNFQVLPQGSLEKRQGSKFLAELEQEEASIFRFSRIALDDSVVVIGDSEVTVWGKTGPALQTGNLNQITDPTFLNGFANWTKYTNVSGAFGTGSTQATLTAISGLGFRSYVYCDEVSDNAETRLTQNITLPSLGASYTFRAKGEFLSKARSFATRGGLLRLEIRNGDTNSIIESSEHIFNASAMGSPSQSMPAVGDILPFEVSVDLSSLPTLTSVNIRIKTEVENYDDKELRIRWSDLEFFDTSTPPPSVEFTTPTEWAGKLGQIQTAMDAATGRMIMAVNNAPMYELTYDRDLDSWDFQPFVPINPQNQDFEDDPPSVCVFFQGRLWLGATPLLPSTLWASETWNYDNFLIPASPTDSDPLEFTLSTNAKIQWLGGARQLLIGTSINTVIGRSEGSVITTTDYDFSSEQGWSSAPFQGVTVGRQYVHISGDTRRIRASFDGGDISNSYESIEPSVNSEHLFDDSLVDIEYAGESEYILSCLKENGSVIQAVYNPELEMNGWFRQVLEGDVQSIASTNDEGGSSLWHIVQRRDGFVSLEYIESNPVTEVMLDGWIETLTSDGNVSGLNWANGTTLSVVIIEPQDNDVPIYSIHPDVEVVSGAITIEEWAWNRPLYVGLNFIATAKTNKLEGSSQTGSAQSQKRRFNEIFLRLYNSYIPKINGSLPPLRSPSDDMTIGVPPITDDVSVGDSGWNDGVITIEQDLPLPTKVSGIFGKASGNQV